MWCATRPSLRDALQLLNQISTPSTTDHCSSPWRKQGWSRTIRAHAHMVILAGQVRLNPVVVKPLLWFPACPVTRVRNPQSQPAWATRSVATTEHRRSVYTVHLAPFPPSLANPQEVAGTLPPARLRRRSTGKGAGAARPGAGRNRRGGALPRGARGPGARAQLPGLPQVRGVRGRRLVSGQHRGQEGLLARHPA